MIHELYTNTNTISTSPHPRRPWRSSVISSSKAARCTCATDKAVRLCSWPRMADSATMSSCCDSLERICIRTSGQQLNCWLDGGLKSGDRRVSISSCSDCIAFSTSLYTSTPYAHSHAIPDTNSILLLCSALLSIYLFYSALSPILLSIPLYYLYTTSDHKCRIYVKKTASWTCIRCSFFIIHSGVPFRFCSTESSPSSLLAPLSSSIALSQSGHSAPRRRPPPRLHSPTWTGLWTLCLCSPWCILFSVLCSLSLSLSLSTSCHSPVCRLPPVLRFPDPLPAGS